MKILTLIAFIIFTFSLTTNSFASENEALTYNDGVVVKKVEMTIKLPTSMSKLFKKVKV